MKTVIIAVVAFVMGYMAGYGTDILVTLQNLAQPTQMEVGESVGSVSSTSTQDRATTTPSSAPLKQEVSAEEDSVTVRIDSLPEGQQKALETIGIDGPAFTLTPEIISCAEGVLGAARVAEIVGGATPSPLEVMRLAPCVR